MEFFFILIGLLCFLVVVMVMLSNTMDEAEGAVRVRQAELADLPSIYKLDQKVSFEYFMPVYQALGRIHSLPAPAHSLLQDELEADIGIFRDAVTLRSNRRIFCAVEPSGNVVGFVLFTSADAKSVTIDLLLVEQSYRKQGIGRSLVEQGLAFFYPQARQCKVYPFKVCNNGARQFYEHLGFVCCGPAPASRKSILGKFEELYVDYTLTLL